MTLQVPKSTVIELLEAYTAGNPLATLAVARIKADGRSIYECGDVPPSSLRRALATKLTIADEKAVDVVGGPDLLRGLEHIGDGPVQVIPVQGPGDTVAVYADFRRGRLAGVLQFGLNEF